MEKKQGTTLIDFDGDGETKWEDIREKVDQVAIKASRQAAKLATDDLTHRLTPYKKNDIFRLSVWA